METFTIVMGSLGGVSFVLTGLIAYFGNLQLERYKSGLEAATLKIRSLLESSVHVSKAQFDKEFSIYQDIWVHLVSLRATALSLRPMMDSHDPTESEEQRMRRRLTAFSESFYRFRDAMENNRPFYAHSVYESLGKIFDLCYTESVEYQHKDPGWSKEYWESSRENGKKIVEAIDACCEQIRNRISSMSIAQ
ncbi:MAG: hypothetical protein Q7T44_08135 [Parvibaculum sp.]|nr:hypothetical protein [Parvibaculum sp.]